MTPNQFAQILTNSGYENLQTMVLYSGDGYYAEKFSHADKDRSEPHWKVVYAVGLDEKMQMAQHRYDAVGTSSWFRLQQSREDAQQILNDNRRVFNG
jgi:hypothetical protein